MKATMERMENLDPSDLIALADHIRDLHGTPLDAAGMPRPQHFLRVLRDAADVDRVLLYSNAGSLEQPVALLLPRLRDAAVTARR